MVSMLKGPIPAHPHYDKSDLGSYIDMPVPRVRPEARDIAAKAQGTVGILLQVEGHRVPTGFRRTRTEPKNHLNENIRRMRQIQRESKRKEQNRPREQPMKALWKSSKFENVAPRVFDFQQESPCAPRSHSAHYLRAHSRTGWNPEPRARPASAGATRPGSAASARSASATPSLKEGLVPRSATARELRLVRHNMNYLQINGQSAKHAQLKRSPSLTALDDLKKHREEEQENYKKGTVPKYLLMRQKQWKRDEEERKANVPDPDLPEGHRKMPDEERKATLKKLQDTEQQLLQQLQSMPVRMDTLRIRTRKEEMEKKLSEVAEAIKIFSRPKVFVKIDS